MEWRDRKWLYTTEGSNYQGRNPGIPRLWRRGTVCPNDWLEPGEYRRSAISSSRWRDSWVAGGGNAISTRNYPSYKGELLAVIQCIKKWKHILNFNPFEVHTDASALKYLTTMKNQSGLFTRWYQELAGFNFTVIHKKGKENSNADALSRSSHMEDAPLIEDDGYTGFTK